MKNALLLIDIQKDYFPGGRMELKGPLEAAKVAYELLQCFREHGLYHVHIQHVSNGAGATFFLPGDSGCDIHDAVAHFEGEPLVVKHFPNSFRETQLLQMLQMQGVQRLVISGMMTHMCVDATARAAADLGFKVIVVEDACATRDLKFGETTIPAEHVHKAFLAALRSYGEVLQGNQVMARLAADREEETRVVATLDVERQDKARQYARWSRRLWLVNTLLSGAYAAAWLGFGWSEAVREWLASVSPAFGNPWLMAPAFVAVFGGGFLLLDLPLSYYGGYVLPHRFGQSTQSMRAWLIDQLKGMLIGALLGLVLLEALYFCLRSTGVLWWLWAGAGMLVFNILMVNLAPVLIMPLFNKYVPLGEEHRELAERLLQLAHKAGTRVQGVYKFDMSRRTKAANAALTGMGGTRRIILGDTLIDEFTPDEVEMVLAHELGHHVHRDIAVLIGMGSLATLAGLFIAARLMDGLVSAFGYAGVGDPAAFPALMLVFGGLGLIGMPLENAVSRWRESLADGYALTATGNSEAFASAMVRLANQNLGEVDPERWVVWMFYSHPPLGERIEAAHRWRATRAD